MKAIRAKVAAILSPHSAAINAGAGLGVRVGDIANVVKRTQIRDPDSKMLLGEVTTPIVTLRITHVSDRFSIANTFRPATVGDLFSILNRMGAAGPTGPDPVERITAVQDPADSAAILVPIGADVDVEKPSPAKQTEPPKPPVPPTSLPSTTE
jgi:Flagellar assembly protein T, C-terminal domain